MSSRYITRTDVQITQVQPLEVIGKEKRSFYLEIDTDAGAKGFYGPIDAEPAILVDRHSRGSHYLIELSAIDNTLWDLRGKLLGLPVYRLLGGSRKTVRAYGRPAGKAADR